VVIVVKNDVAVVNGKDDWEDVGDNVVKTELEDDAIDEEVLRVVDVVKESLVGDVVVNEADEDVAVVLGRISVKLSGKRQRLTWL
jgi:hypothetical protein